MALKQQSNLPLSNLDAPGPWTLNQFGQVMDNFTTAQGGEIVLRALAAPHINDKALFRVPLKLVSRLFYLSLLISNLSFVPGSHRQTKG